MPPNTLRVDADLHAEIVEVEIEIVSPSIVPSGNFAELNRTVTCMVLKANDRRTSSSCHDEFRGPLSDYVRQCRKIQHPPLSRIQRGIITKLPFNFTTGCEIYEDLFFGSLEPF
ncbi:hypothetical protein TNCV_3907071 [Trichonephila clavipes]|nr:hypothetical protein TNCV_3907071 [Trichonephila clavipes]